MDVQSMNEYLSLTMQYSLMDNKDSNSAFTAKIVDTLVSNSFFTLFLGLSFTANAVSEFFPSTNQNAYPWHLLGQSTAPSCIYNVVQRSLPFMKCAL